MKHVIWSTLEDTRQFMPADDKRMPMLQEKYRVPHFDAKAEADAFFKDVPTTFLLTTFYWDNLYMFGLAPKRGEDGGYKWAFPMGDKKLAGIAAEDIGKTAYGILKAGTQYVGKKVGIYGEALTINEMGEQAVEGDRDSRAVLPCRRGRRVSRLRLSRAPTRWATCSSTTATSIRSSSRCATSTPRAR